MAKPFGPVEGWHATYTGSEPAIIVETAQGSYACTKPSNEYRALFADVQEQARLCHALVQTLKGKEGKGMSFDAGLAALGRAKIVKGYLSLRDAVLINGAFILGQQAAMQSALGSDFVLAETEFIKGLQAEVR